MNIIALFVTFLANVCHPTPAAHHHHHVARHASRAHATVVPNDRDIIFHNDAQYRSVREWCVNNPNRCVRVGNTYIVNGQ